MHAHRRPMAIPIRQHERNRVLWRHIFGTASLACGVGALWCAFNVPNFAFAVGGMLALLAAAVLLHVVCEAVG